MTVRVRELESTAMHAGLGVSLVDAFTGGPAFGPIQIYLDVDAGGGAWRALPDAKTVTTASGTVWFPWLERYADARGRAPRNYRVRVVAADVYTPSYLYTDDGVVQPVYPYDDVNPPAVAAAPVVISMLPGASYPYAPVVPVMRGAITNIFGDPVPNALVSWVDLRATPPAPVPPLVTDTVLSDDDGEFRLPMRRAPLGVLVELYARRPPPPGPPGPSRTVQVTLPADLSTFQNIMIL